MISVFSILLLIFIFFNIITIISYNLKIFLIITDKSNNIWSFIYICIYYVIYFINWIYNTYLLICLNYFNWIFEKLFIIILFLLTFIKNIFIYFYSIVFYIINKFYLFFNILIPNSELSSWNLQIYNYLALNLLILIFSFLIHVVFSIWARAAGPRVRIDQMSKLTWKDYIFGAVGVIFIIIFCSIV